MAKWLIGPEMTYWQVKDPDPNNPLGAIGRLYRDGEILTTPDDVVPGRTWKPLDASATAIVKKAMAGFMKEPPNIDDIDDEKQQRKYNRMLARWNREQQAIACWTTPPPVTNTAPEPLQSLHSLAAAQGKSVRPSDRSI